MERIFKRNRKKSQIVQERETEKDCIWFNQKKVQKLVKNIRNNKKIYSYELDQLRISGCTIYATFLINGKITNLSYVQIRIKNKIRMLHLENFNLYNDLIEIKVKNLFNK